MLSLVVGCLGGLFFCSGGSWWVGFFVFNVFFGFLSGNGVGYFFGEVVFEEGV